MPVTDLSAMPWWANQGGQPNGGPTPPGYSGTSWLDYLASMFNPVSSAQAAENDPIAALNRGGTPPVNNAIDASQVPPLADSVTKPPQGPGMGILPQARGQAVQDGPMAPGDAILPQGASRGVQPYGPPLPPGGLHAGAAAAPAPQGAAPQGAPRPAIAMPYGTAQRGPGSAPIITAADWSGLFGGGQPAANPANVPARNAQPVSGRVPGPMAQGGMSRAPWGMGPMQKGMVFPDSMGPFFPGQQAARDYQGTRMTSPYNYS